MRLKKYESLRRSNDVSGPNIPRPEGLGRKWPCCFVLDRSETRTAESRRVCVRASGSLSAQRGLNSFQTEPKRTEFISRPGVVALRPWSSSTGQKYMVAEATTPEVAPSKHNHPPRLAAGEHVGVGIVDLRQGVPFGDETVEVEVAGAVQIQQHGKITPGVYRAVVGAFHGLFLARENRAGQVSAGAHRREPGQYEIAAGPAGLERHLLDLGEPHRFEGVIRAPAAGHLPDLFDRVGRALQSMSRAEIARRLEFLLVLVDADDRR